MKQQIPIRALVIASPAIDRILEGVKTWEMHSTNCRIRGPIGRIKKGSGKVVGVAEITDVIGPLSPAELLANQLVGWVSGAYLRSAMIDNGIGALRNPTQRAGYAACRVTARLAVQHFAKLITRLTRPTWLDERARDQLGDALETA